MGVEVDHLVGASAYFGEQLTKVEASDWELPTPCPDWDVRAVVAHVVVGDSQVPLLYRGETVERQTEFSSSVLGPDPVAAWRGTALAAIEAFRRPGALDRVLHHPLGALPGRWVIGFRVTENLVHGWDVATAIGKPVEPPEAIADWCLDIWLPMVDELARSGHFGDPIMPPEGASAGVRLLALLGRQA